jgi:hypothetical protein
MPKASRTKERSAGEARNVIAYILLIPFPIWLLFWLVLFLSGQLDSPFVTEYDFWLHCCCAQPHFSLSSA